jgi:uncharacterized protein
MIIDSLPLTLGFLPDWQYFAMVGPFMLLSLIAGFLVKKRFAWGARIMSPRGFTGAQIARAIADHHNLQHVSVEPSQGHLSDHYDPTAKALRLSPEVYSGQSLAAFAVAAHEVGHAIQDKERYAPLVFRSKFVPIANIGSSIGMYVFMGGLMLDAFTKAPAISELAKLFMLGGIILFSTVVLFQVFTLFTEFDASARARRALMEMGFVTPQEDGTVKKVLNAAAMTYIAGALTALMTLLYFILKFTQANNRE